MGQAVGFGARGRNRTRDIFITSEVLYQLSYSGGQTILGRPNDPKWIANGFSPGRAQDRFPAMPPKRAGHQGSTSAEPSSTGPHHIASWAHSTSFAGADRSVIPREDGDV
jgi:hypothetical protein